MTRRQTISECIDFQLAKVKELKKQHDANPDDPKVYRKLKADQTQVSWRNRTELANGHFFSVASAVSARTKRGRGNCGENEESVRRAVSLCEP